MVFFFFSSRRRHTRWTGDWSSDVCSSDLLAAGDAPQQAVRAIPYTVGIGIIAPVVIDRKSVVLGKSVDLGGRRIIKKKKKKKKKRKKEKNENKDKRIKKRKVRKTQ